MDKILWHRRETSRKQRRQSLTKWLPLEYQGDVFVSGYEFERPVEEELLMERMLERENVMSALRRVEANRGSAGRDGSGHR